jgi:hypothetical protein
VAGVVRIAIAVFQGAEEAREVRLSVQYHQEPPY